MTLIDGRSVKVTDEPCYLNTVADLLKPDVLAGLSERDRENLAVLLTEAIGHVEAAE